MNYFAILLPITFGYMANYYALKHENKILKDSYTWLVKRQNELIKIIKLHDINTIDQKMSENEETNAKE